MRRSGWFPWLLGLTVLPPSTALAHLPPRPAVGSLVSVSVDVDGREAPLYAAPDRSGRFYLEALAHSGYALRLSNHTGERLGVVVTVDGLNAISGEREPGLPAGRGPAGRMYVLGPWDSVTVQGWRTSLDEVRRFTFVDEKRSYAARSGKANGKMGWIELAVYREVRPAYSGVSPLGRDRAGAAAEGRDEGERDASARADAPRHAPPSSPQAVEPAAPGSYPGTGWGSAAHDPAVLVEFDPQPHPAERMTLRYEYASGLRALGIDVRSGWTARDRLRERDRGQEGFAKPPAW
jgi:hypothetical protein